MKYYITIDIGGTNVRLALFAETEAGQVTLIKKESRTIPRDYEEGLRFLVDEITKLKAGQKLTGVALALPGLVDTENGVITDSANLTTYQNKPIKKDLEEKLDLEVRIVNDVFAAALGEAVHGLGKGKKVFNFIIWGTGFCASNVKRFEEKIHISTTDFGWHLIQWEGSWSSASDERTPEYYVGGGSLSRQHGDLAKLSDSDPLWDEVSQKAAQGLINLLFFHPTKHFVFGGGLILKRPFLLKKIEKLIAENQNVFEVPTLELSELGDTAALYGLVALFSAKII